MLKEYFRHNIINSIGTITIGLASWLFGFLILKLTSADDVSAYNSFAALLLIAALPARWVNLMAISTGNLLSERIVTLIKRYSKPLLLVTGLSLVIFAVIFNLSELSIWLYASLIIVVALSLFVSYYKGLLQHERLFSTLSILGIIEVVLKIMVFLGLVYLGFPSLSMFMAIIVQYIVSAVTLWLYTNKTAKVTSVISIPVRKINISANLKKAGALALFYGFSYLVMTNIDFVFSRVYLDSETNKAYIGLTQILKFFLFGATALINVFLPTLQKYTTQKEIRKLSLVTSGLVILGGVFMLIISLMYFDLLAGLFEFTTVSQFDLVVLIIGNIAFALAQIPLTILLVKEKFALIVITVSTALLQIIAYAFFSRTLSSFVYMFTIVSFILLALSLFAMNKNIERTLTVFSSYFYKRKANK